MGRTMVSYRPMLVSYARRCTLAMILAAGLVLAAPSALAQVSVTDQALAQALFNQGKKLMAEGKYAEACKKFAASNRTAPGTGTLLNLAVCHEKVGKLASAWVEFSNAADSDRSAGNQRRLAYSVQEMNKLAPQLAHITISPPPGASIPGLVVKLDGAKISDAALGTPAPVDPGVHTIVASAPGRQAWSKQVKIEKNGEQKTVAIPALAASATPTTQPAPSASAATPKPAPSPGPASPAPEPSTNGRRIAAYVTGGVGVVGIALGSYFGLKAFSDWKTRNNNCPGGHCNQAAVDAHDSAHTAAIVSDVGFGVGVAALGAATYLWLTSSPHSSEKPPGDTARWRIEPVVGAKGGALSVGRTF